MEKAIMLKLKVMDSELLKIGPYQTGFKEGQGTAMNIMSLTKVIKEPRVPKS